MLTHITMELLENQVTQARDVLRNTKSHIATESGLKIWPADLEFVATVATGGRVKFLSSV